jgi:hypothetical protein
MPTDDNVMPFEPGPPGHHHIPGTDLEVVFDRRGEDLVLRVNKGPVQIFRVLLVGATKEMTDAQLLIANMLGSDTVVHMVSVGDIDEGLRRLTAAASETAPR